jgi:hypothetical protein
VTRRQLFSRRGNFLRRRAAGGSAVPARPARVEYAEGVDI